MKVLALGATGAIGGRMLESLRARGCDLHVTSRSPRASAEGVTYVLGDAKDDAFLAQLLREDWDVIADFMVYRTPEFRDRLDRLLGACGQYVFISSARVFAEASGPIVESSPRLLDVCDDAAYLATDEYALTKARQEDLLRTSGPTNWTIVRPYITFGEGRLQLGTFEKEDWLYRALQGRSIVFCAPMMDRRTTLTEGEDVARMIAALIGAPAARGEDFNLTGGRSVAWSEVLALYLNVLEERTGRRPRVVLQDLEAFCAGVRNVDQVRRDRMYNRSFDPSKIAALFDMRSLHDPLLALADRLRAQIAAGDGFKNLDWRNEALRDRCAGERASLGEIRGWKPKLRYIAHRNLPQSLLNRVM